MPDYSLAELARLADVTPRTIRYYVAQGLLPSPDPAGPATRYGDAHLARLRLIRRLQREHLPLAEIRVRLSAMTEREIEATVDRDAADQRATGGTALDYVRGLMARQAYPDRAGGHPLPRPQATFLREMPEEFPVRNPEPGASPTSPSPGAPPAPSVPAPRWTPPAPPASPASPAPPPDRSTWERITLHPDVELHVRRPLDRATNKRVDRLARIARELFEDDTP